MIAGQPQDGEGIGPGAAETAIALGYQQRRKTGLLDRRPKIAEFADIVIRKDLPAAFKELAALGEEGGNPVQFTKDLIHYLRKVLSLKLNPDLEKTFERELTKDEVAVVKKMGAAAETAFLVTVEQALIRAYSEMRYSPFAVVPLEIALVENLKKVESR